MYYITTCVIAFFISVTQGLPKAVNITKNDHPLSGIGKIIGGRPVLKNEMLYVLSMEVRSENVTYICGASAIAADWAISAAHCTENGQHPDDITLRSDSKWRWHGKRHRVEKYVLHPNYKAVVKNDISLLKVKDPFIVGESLSFVSYNGKYKLKMNKILYTAGWGKTESEDSSEYLLKTKIKYITNSKCKKIHRYHDYGFVLTDGMLCGSFEGRDTAEGDSGGPLVIRRDSGDILVGIVSYGEGKGKKNGPGIYTRVRKYVDWINEVTSDYVGSGDGGILKGDNDDEDDDNDDEDDDNNYYFDN